MPPGVGLGLWAAGNCEIKKEKPTNQPTALLASFIQHGVTASQRAWSQDPACSILSRAWVSLCIHPSWCCALIALKASLLTGEGCVVS